MSFLAGFLLLDLMRYAVHRCKHAVPFFWRFHALHHSDPDVDVTTAVRLHPIEYLLSSAVFWVAVIVLDIPAIVGVTSVSQHSPSRPSSTATFACPSARSGGCSRCLVTVDMHRIHHSVSFAQASCNYAAVLSVWDRLFGTYTRLTRAQHESIVFGVRELPRRDCLKPSAMLLTPWRISRGCSYELTGPR